MSRTLILNISASAQTLPAEYGGHSVAVGHGRVVAVESSLVVTAMGGFAAIDGSWVVYSVSTDTAEGDYDVAAGGVALLATFVPNGDGGTGGPVNWADILGKPSFATVATSGSYEDLADVPTLAAVAESGLYSDLSGTPTIPSAGNTVTDVGNTGGAGVGATFARVDHQHGHGNLNGGTLHSTATTVSAGFMSAADKSKLDGLANFSGNYADLTGAPVLSDVATSGDYNDLSNTPAPFSGSYNDLTDAPALAPVATSGAYADLSGTPALADVATSGAYGDLSGAPALVPVATSGAYSDLSNRTYDLMGDAVGDLTVGKVLRRAYAPRNLILQSLFQGSTTTATVVVKVDGVEASYPQAVSSGQLITVVVTAAGTDCWFTIAGKEA